MISSFCLELNKFAALAEDRRLYQAAVHPTIRLPHLLLSLAKGIAIDEYL